MNCEVNKFTVRPQKVAFPDRAQIKPARPAYSLALQVVKRKYES